MQSSNYPSSKIKKWAKKSKVVDVIGFGSRFRSSQRSNDLDLCIVFPDDQEKVILDIVASLKSVLDEKNAHISSISQSDFILGKQTLVSTLMTEGISMISGEPVSERFGLKAKSLFQYSLQGFTASNRVRFHYAMRGRNGLKGVLVEYHADILGDGVLSVETKFEDRIKEILDQWAVKYSIKRILSS